MSRVNRNRKILWGLRVSRCCNGYDFMTIPVRGGTLFAVLLPSFPHASFIGPCSFTTTFSSRVHVSESAVPMRGGFLEVDLEPAVWFDTSKLQAGICGSLDKVPWKKFWKYLRAWGGRISSGERAPFYRKRLREYIRNNWCVASCKMKVSAKERDRFASPCLREGRANGFSDMKRRRWCNKETRSEANRYQASAVFKRWLEIKCVQLRYRKIKQREHLLDAFDLLLRPAKRHTRHVYVTMNISTRDARN